MLLSDPCLWILQVKILLTEFHTKPSQPSKFFCTHSLIPTDTKYLVYFKGYSSSALRADAAFRPLSPLNMNKESIKMKYGPINKKGATRSISPTFQDKNYS